MPANISYNIFLFCFGAITLAGIYHSVLFFHRRSALLWHYCLYLSSLFIYMTYRFWMVVLDQPIAPFNIPFTNIKIHIDAVLLWLLYIAYVRFWGNALQLKKEEGRFTWFFYKTATPLIITYIIFENLAANISLGILEQVFFIIIRVYLGGFGFYVTMLALKKRKKIYYSYLAGGSIAIIVSSLISTYVHLVSHSFLYINAFGWMMVGYFTDVIFFSAAVGVRLKEESVQRLVALQKVLDQQAEISRLEIENMKAVYETREEERNRISAELHDDLGGGLSTIRLMAEMVSKAHLNVDMRHLEFISEKSQELIENMNEIIWSLNNKTDSLAGMIAHIRQYAFKYLEHTAIELNFNATMQAGDIQISAMIRRQLFLLLKESLHNILKHSGASHVKINADCTDHLLLKISDNGKGIASDAVNGNGLINMQKRISKLNGTISIYADAGTTIILQVPLQQA